MTYTSNPNFNGLDSFTFKADNGILNSNIANVSITVNSVNDTPTLDTIGSVNIYEDAGPQRVNISGISAGGGESQILTVTATSNNTALIPHPSANYTSPNSTGSLSYTPVANQSGTAIITVTVLDNGGTTNGGVNTFSRTFVVTVNAVNDAPIAMNNAITTDEDMDKIFTAIMFNFSDVDVGNTLSKVQIMTLPVKGILFKDADNDGIIDTGETLTPNSEVTVAEINASELKFHPASNENGNNYSSFQFKVHDGSIYSTSAYTMTIHVTAVNDAPFFTSSPITVVDENTPYTYAITADDPDNTALTITATVKPDWLTLADQGDGTAILSGAPTDTEVGSHSVILQVSDGILTKEQEFIVTVRNVNDPPHFTSTPLVEASEDSLYSYTAMATDPNGDPLAITASTRPAWLTVTDQSDGTALVTGTPTVNELGNHNVVLEVSDGEETVNQSFSITVQAVNDAPVLSALSEQTIAEDTGVTIPFAAQDEEGDYLTFTLTSSDLTLLPAIGMVVKNLTNPDDQGNTHELTLTPAPNQHGSVTVTLSVSDGLVGAFRTLALTVTPVNDAPVAVDDAASTSEDTAMTAAVLGNDSDMDGDGLIVSDVVQPTHGTVSIQGGEISYIPEANYNGPDSFAYTVSDSHGGTDTAVVHVTVTPVNDAPVADAQSVTTEEDVSKPLTLTGSDVEGDALTFTVVSAPSHGTLSGTTPNLTYTPALNFNGTDSFTFTVNDGAADSAPAPVNDAPLANTQSVTSEEDDPQPITLTGSDIEGSILTYNIVSSPSHGSLTGTAPNLIYITDLNYNGSDQFTFTVNDGDLDSTPATITIIVNPINDVPMAVNDTATTDEDTTVTLSVLVNDSDVDGDALTVSNISQPAHGVATIQVEGIVYTPASNFNGSDSFIYTINDGNEFSTGTVSVTVIPVNDIPMAQASSATTDEDTTVSGTVTATDEDGDALTYAVVTSPDKGTLSLGANGSFTYTPTLNFNGSDSFTFTATDGTEISSPAAVVVTVNPVNDNPVASADSVTTDEDTATSIQVIDNDTDVDSDLLLVSGVMSSTHGNAVANDNGTIIYTPTADYHGQDTFIYTVSDSHGGTDTAEVTVTVTPVNDSPVAQDDSVTTDEDTSTPITLTGADVEGEPLNYSIASNPIHGSLMGTAPNLTYTPALNYNGSDSFTFTVNDGTADSAPATISIIVSPVNDAPVACAQSVTTDEDSTKAITLTGSDVEGDAFNVVKLSRKPFWPFSPSGCRCYG